MIDGALPDALVRRARAAVSRLGAERFRQSYFTTFWLPRGEPAGNVPQNVPQNVIEEAVLALARHARVRCAGYEWWIGRTYTNDVPIEFHFDEDVKGTRRRHPLVSSVFFFNAVRGGQLAITDATPGRAPQRLEAVTPRRNRYALFAGNLLHGVLDRDGQTPTRPLPGPRGRLRVTLVINYWDAPPGNVPQWKNSRAYRALSRRG